MSEQPIAWLIREMRGPHRDQPRVMPMTMFKNRHTAEVAAVRLTGRQRLCIAFPVFNPSARQLGLEVPDLLTALEAARRRVGALEGALEPFSRHADLWHASEPADALLTEYDDDNDNRDDIRVGDCRRARTALEPHHAD